MWEDSPIITKIGIFRYKFSQIYPLKRFLQNLARGCPRYVPSRQISPLSLLQCGLTAPKIVKNGNFWYKFAPKGKFWESTEKLEFS